MSAYSDLIASITSVKAWYRLNESSGLVASDSSGNGYHGSLSGVAAYSQPQLVAFDGDAACSFTASGGLTVPSSLSLAILSSWTELSLVFWIALGGQTHCVGVVLTTTTSTYYLDGIATIPGSGGSILVSQALDMIGSLSSAGTLDEVVICNAALSADMFARLASAGGINIGYTSTHGTGGSDASWLRDVANSRLVATGGTEALLIYDALTALDVDLLLDLRQSQSAGLVWRYQDTGNYYELIVKDSVAGNSYTLKKRSGGTLTTLATAAIDFTTATAKRCRVTMLGGIITAYLDGVQILTYTDGSPLASGKTGLRNDTGTSYIYNWRVQPLAPDASSLSVKTRLTLSSTDPTATPQVLDMQTMVASEDVGKGSLVPEAKYIRTYLSDNVADLARRSDYATAVRNDKSVVFHQREAFPAPWILDSANVRPFAGQSQGDVLVKDLKIATGAQLYRNRQILTGVRATATYSEIRVGDGTRRTWTLDNPLAAPPTILLNGRLVTVGVLGVDTGRQYYYQIGSNVITQDDSEDILASTDVLSFPNYQGTYETEVERNNATAGTFPGTISQEELATRSRTSGIVENVLDVSDQQMSVEAAEAYGDSLLQLYGDLEGQTVQASTLRSGLAVGQELSVFIPQHQLVDVTFLIVSISITAQIAPQVPGGVLYWYDVVGQTATNLGSVYKRLNALLRRK